MRRTRGLSTRLVAAISLLAALHLTVFVVLLVTLHDLGAADREARAVAKVAMTSNDIRIALAHDDAPGMRAGAVALAQAGRAAGQRDTTALARDVRAYAVAHPVDRALYPETPAARALDGRLETLVTRERAARTAERDRVARLTRLAWIAGTTGVVATLLCAIGVMLYLRRALLAPLRGVVDAARRLAAGDLHARVGRRDGIGEVGELARTFDQMADSLEESRAALERQNRELAQQRSELIEAVRSAREGASIVRAVLDTTPDAIALLDGDGAVIVDNPPMRAVRAAFAMHATTLDPRTPFVRDGASRDGADEAERRDEVVLPGGRRTFARYAAPVHDGRGRLIGRLLVVREITAEREAERAKQDFFALVSHELRTPLTAILGYVELVLSDDAAPFPPEHARHLEVIDRNAHRLVRIVGDLLFAAQVEGAPLLLEPGELDLVALVRDAVELARPHAEQAGVALVEELEPVERCIGDRDRIAQVLDNLLSNALKFTPLGGRVVVRLANDGAQARIEVADTGAGIAADDQPHLFDRFYRARSATVRSVPGLGLGLTIVRTIVEGHGGTVSVDSEVGRGTTFTILLPAVGSGSRSRAPSRADHRSTAPSPASDAGSRRRA
ncbi:MAG TPA: ATP-binding protein [Conexibacter sp.]|jgi:signal transduction histidine kinase|nr:ATP-binding protein [Conexibacter sp.]